ncbi:MAG: hypothetical protein RRC34_07650 [Lentisphaeria bacterium]|nr:hypothetical protein [Lentisphaeria bacterium]
MYSRFTRTSDIPDGDIKSENWIPHGKKDDQKKPSQTEVEKALRQTRRAEPGVSIFLTGYEALLALLWQAAQLPVELLQFDWETVGVTPPGLALLLHPARTFSSGVP